MEESISPAPNYVRRALALFAGYGETEALVAVDGRRFSFADLRSRILNTSAALWEHGVRPGMTVGMLVTNSAESFFVELGAHLIGTRNVLLQPWSPKPVLRASLGYVGADAFIYDANDLDELGRQAVEGAAPTLTLCIGTGGLGPDLTDPPAMSELPFDPDTIGVAPEALFQTSGTTGTPKLLRHAERFYRTVPKVAEFYRPRNAPRIKHLSLSGSWHAGGQSAALMTWLSGGLYVMQPDLNIETYLATVEQEQITSVHIAPPDLYQLLDSPLLATADLSTLHAVTVCCSAAAPARLVQAARFFGPALNIVYGMSELPMITVLPDVGDPAHPERLASCGLPWADNRVEIRDATGPLLAGEVGEIWVTGDFLTEGYWNSPELNAENLVDGWLRTGDVGRLDSDGYLYIVDRVTDMILTDLGSRMVYCRPIEDALAEHGQVRQAAVVGVPDDLMGEAVHAFVIRTAEATVTEEQLRQHVTDMLGAAWSPREIEFVATFPVNDFGKVDKKQLRARYLASSR